VGDAANDVNVAVALLNAMRGPNTLNVTFTVNGPVVEFVALTVKLAVYVPAGNEPAAAVMLSCWVAPGLIVLFGPDVFAAVNHPVGWPAV